MPIKAEDINKLLNIPTFKPNEKTIEELDQLAVNRFNISDFDINTLNEYKKLSNFHVFPIFNKDNSTGYTAMCVSKKFANVLLENSKKQNQNKQV